MTLPAVCRKVIRKADMTMTIEETIIGLQELFNANAAAGLNKTIQFNISGDDAHIWALKIANQTCELIRGGVEKPDLTLSVIDKDWIAIAERKLNPTNAYLTGKLKATGDITLAMRIPSLFGLK
jgi:putative sterol carrier protein